MVRDRAHIARHRLFPWETTFPYPPAANPVRHLPKPSVHPASTDKLALISGIIIAGVVLAGLVVLLAAVKRGLDLTDESDYIQSEMHAGAYLRASTEFQLLLGPVLSLVRQVWLLRAVKLVGLVAAHVFFVWCFIKTAPSLIGARFKRLGPNRRRRGDRRRRARRVEGPAPDPRIQRSHGLHRRDRLRPPAPARRPPVARPGRAGGLVRGRVAHLVAAPRAMAFRDGDRPAGRDRIPLDRPAALGSS